MSRRKMLILRGNAAAAGMFPDERGVEIAWPSGALHVDAAVEYARRKGYKGVVLDKPGNPQGQTSPQAKAALKNFQDDEMVTALYGFSGGGYNVRHILYYLSLHQPATLSRIDLVVVIGSPKQPKINYHPSSFRSRGGAHPGKWEVVYRIDPPRTALPSGLPRGTKPHMFGPDVLLRETPAGRYRDFPFDDEC
ncbi:hypothetical protein [Muricoccus radiodurans]|uniref:hypothetical protein n=1 Tax=Muricoccus radiodurans TaxID=2231721 RepID=UPI003CF15022